MVATAEAARALDRKEVEQLVREVLTQRLRGQVDPPPARERHAAMPLTAGGPPHPLVVNVSARHMHVTPEHLEGLFGAGGEVNPPPARGGHAAATPRAGGRRGGMSRGGGGPPTAGGWRPPGPAIGWPPPETFTTSG